MQDTAKPDDEILIVTIKENYWMAMGIDFLDAVITGLEPYPTPIACVAFRDMDHLREYVEEGVDGLWKIHPQIIERLRNAGELTDKVID